MQNIGPGEFLDIDRVFIAETHFNSLPRNHCKPGDVLIGTLGDPNLRACILPESIDRALNKADCILLRPNASIATSEYICQLINTHSLLLKATKFALGQTRLRISMGRLKNLDVPIASLALQNKFSQLTKNIKKLKSLKNSQLATLDGLNTSLQHRAFKGEL